MVRWGQVKVLCSVESKQETLTPAAHLWPVKNNSRARGGLATTGRGEEICAAWRLHWRTELCCLHSHPSGESPLCQHAPRISLKLTSQNKCILLSELWGTLHWWLGLPCKWRKAKKASTLDCTVSAPLQVIKQRVSDAYHKAFCYNRAAVSCFPPLVLSAVYLSIMKGSAAAITETLIVFVWNTRGLCWSDQVESH